MRYYLTFVVFGLLMFGVCVVLQPHPFREPGIAMMTGLFGAHDDAEDAASGMRGGQEAPRPA